MKKKNQWLYIAGLLLVLTAALAVLIIVQNRPADDNDQRYYIADIDFSLIDKHTSVGTGQSKHEGYLITDVFTNLGIDIGSLNTVTFHAFDGVRMIFSANELKSAEALLEVRTTAGRSEYRIIFPHDQFRNRWLKNISHFDID